MLKQNKKRYDTQQKTALIESSLLYRTRVTLTIVFVPNAFLCVEQMPVPSLKNLYQLKNLYIFKSKAAHIHTTTKETRENLIPYINGVNSDCKVNIPKSTQ